MKDLMLIYQPLDPNGYWTSPIPVQICPNVNVVDLFDQNGYDLTDLEILYSKVNYGWHSEHRNYTHIALKKNWFAQHPKDAGAILNHALTFERKGYRGAALEQLKNWAKTVPSFYKVVNLRPKWGIDFSMDYAGYDGEVFEVLHYEYDGFDFNEVADRKSQLELYFVQMDWDHAASCLLRRKDQWHSLDFFAQSDWKCNFFGIGPERFKMVAWS